MIFNKNYLTNNRKKQNVSLQKEFEYFRKLINKIAVN